MNVFNPQCFAVLFSHQLSKKTTMKINLLQVSTVASTFFVFPMHFLNIRNYFFQVSFPVPFCFSGVSYFLSKFDYYVRDFVRFYNLLAVYTTRLPKIRLRNLKMKSFPSNYRLNCLFGHLATSRDSLVQVFLCLLEVSYKSRV